MKLRLLLILGIVLIQQAQAQNPLLIKMVSGTTMVPADYSQFYAYQEWNGKYFYLGDDKRVLCVTDGTTAGTQAIYTFTPVAGAPGNYASVIGAAQDFLYIVYTTQYANATPFSNTMVRQQIWKTDGTTTGTQLVASFDNTIYRTIAFNEGYAARQIMGNTLFFNNTTAAEGIELWKTDGTASGTMLLKDINPGSGNSGPVAIVSIGNKVIFRAYEPVYGSELWSSDGTTAGTQLVKDINPGTDGSSIVAGNYVAACINNKYVSHALGSAATGAEPWVSDGTAAGTYMLKDIVSGSGSSHPIVSFGSSNFLTSDEYIFFRTNPASSRSAGYDVWRTDGTPEGTIFLSAADSIKNLGGTARASGKKCILFYSLGNIPLSGIIISDGTPAGTKSVDTIPSSANGGPIIYKNAGYFGTARRSNTQTTFYDAEMYRTDGTKPNTSIIFDLTPGAAAAGIYTFYNSTSPRGLFTLNNYLYFFGVDPANNVNLYRYNADFTFNGTVGGKQWRDSANWNSGFPPGITDTVNITAGITPNLTNGRAYAAVLNMPAGTQINLVNATDSIFINNNLQTSGSNLFTGNGGLVLKSITGNTVQLANGFTAPNVSVQSNSNLQSGTINISNSLQLNSGKLTINNSNVVLTGSASSATGNASGYVITNGTGKLSVQNVGTGGRTGTVSFPIGTITNYNPVLLSNAGVADAFSIGVKDGINNSYNGETATGATYATNAVDAMWFISEETAGSSNANISLQWNAAQELPGFDRSMSRFGHYTSGNWQLGAIGTASGSNPYTFSGTGVTDFSPFGIFNNNAILPLTTIRLSVLPAGSGNRLLWAILYPNATTISLEKSTDAVRFTTLTSLGYSATGNYVDAAVSNGKTWYRLKLTDGNGKIAYSSVVLVNAGAVSAPFGVYPNPVKDVIHFNQYFAEGTTIQIVNSLGQIVEQGLFSGNYYQPGSLQKGVFKIVVVNKANGIFTTNIIH